MNLLKFAKTVLVIIFMVLWFYYGVAIMTGMVEKGFSWLLFAGILLTVVNMLAFVNIVALVKKTNTLIKIALVGDILMLAYAFTFLSFSRYSISMIIIGLTIIYFPIYLALGSSKSETKAA